MYTLDKEFTEMFIELSNFYLSLIILLFTVSGMTAAVRDHTETVMAMLVGGEMDSVDSVVWEDTKCRMECVTG